MRYLRETPAPAPDLWNIQRNAVSKDFPRERARTDLCGLRRAIGVPTATK